MRNLATVQTIKSLDKIEGKDRIVYASFERVGFRVIVSSDLKVGQKVIYCEVDSLLPVRPEFEFLRSRCFNEKFNGFRIRNMKMGSCYSEGLVLPPLEFFPIPESAKDGTDVTEKLGITKYDPEALEEQGSQHKKTWLQTVIYRYKILFLLYKCLTSLFKEDTSWPTWASKSDETRAQALPYIFEKYQGQEWYATEKMDGQSALYGIVKGKFYVCSRNLRCLDPAKGANKTNHWDYATQSSMETKLKAMRKKLGYDFYIQAELCGPSIQGNKYGFTERRAFVFNIRNINTKMYLPYAEIQDLCNEFGLECVQLIGHFVWNYKNIPELQKAADGYSAFGNKVLREGIVLRSSEVRDPDVGQSNMCSLKVISPSFDIKHSK